MKFRTTRHNAVTLIALEGSLLGGPDASELNGLVHDSIAAGTTKVAIDLGKVEFINSTGLGILIGCASALQKAGGRMLIASAPRKILELIKISKLTGFLQSTPTVKDALEQLNQ